MRALDRIDHIVYGVHDLEAGIEWFEELTGVRPVFGGRHLKQGTHNALVRIGEMSYLELLAIDPANRDFPAAGDRWMGIDLLEETKMIRWAIKSSNVPREAAFLAADIVGLGEVRQGERRTPKGHLLNWELSMPLASPVVETRPFLIDWKESQHPATGLERHCQLTHISLEDPSPKFIQNTLGQLNIHTNVLPGEKSKICVQIKGPKGLITLS